MDYLFTFIEGIASFISPCLLPMLPIYISYFIGKNEKKTSKTVLNAVGFVLGFTIVFLILSIFASQLGSILSSNIRYIKIVSKNYNLIIMRDYLPIIGEINGRVEIGRDDETINMEKVKGYYMHKKNEFSLLVEQGDTTPVSLIEEESKDA